MVGAVCGWFWGLYWIIRALVWFYYFSSADISYFLITPGFKCDVNVIFLSSGLLPDRNVAVRLWLWPRDCSTHPNLGDQGWNCLKSVMRGLSVLNWTDGTKARFSTDGCKWIKWGIFFLFSFFFLSPPRLLIMYVQVWWLFQMLCESSGHKHPVWAWTACHWALAAGYDVVSVLCVCVSWQLWCFSRLSVSGKFTPHPPPSAAKVNWNVIYLCIREERSRRQKCLHEVTAYQRLFA